MGNFVQLHLHTALGSFLDGIGFSNEYAEKAALCGHKAIAITDHGRMCGLFDHQKACDSKGIKPILGIEMYLNNDLETIITNDKGKEKRVRTKNEHIILLAKNEVGYKNLLYLNYISNKDARHFYYSPRVSTEELFAHSEGIIVGTACIGSSFANLLKEGKVQETEQLVDKYLSVFKDDFYIEIQINEITGKVDSLEEGQKSCNSYLIDMANRKGIPVVLTGDVHYVNKEDAEIQSLSLQMRSKATKKKEEEKKEGEEKEEKERFFDLETKNLYYHDVDDYKKLNIQFNYNYSEDKIISWCDNSVVISDKCSFRLPERTKMILPKVTGTEEGDLLRFIEIANQEFNKLDKSTNEEYVKKFEQEMNVFISKGMFSYILILYDIFNYTKRENIVHGPARGSACGSIILYAMGITTIDPIEHGLIFERFISESRCVDMVYDYWGN